MDTPEKVDSLFVFEAGSINTIIKDNHGTIITNSPDEATAKATSEARDDEDIHMAIVDLYDATDESGNKIFTEQGQWYAVYRVLKEYCNYPDKMTDFVSLIKKNGWAVEKPLCKYESIASISNTLPKLTVKVSLWQQHKSINDKYAKQCIIAEKMLKLLEII